MAQLVLPYPDFQPNTKIVSAQVDANNAAIVNLLNGGLGPDNVLFPFLATGTLGADKSGTADAVTQGYNSRDLALRGSGWDGAAAQDRDIILRQVMTSATAYKLGVYRKEGAVETLLASFDQAGNQVLTGNLTANGTGHNMAGMLHMTNLGSSVQLLLERTDTDAGAMGIGADINGFTVWDSTGVTKKFMVSQSGTVQVYGGVVGLSGARPITIDATVGGVRIQASAAGWADVFAFSGSAGADLGGFGARGTGDALAYFFIGNYVSPLVKVDPTTGNTSFKSPGARVYHDAAQAIVTATGTVLAFNSERWDTDAIHDLVTNNSRLTCKTAGKYAVLANVAFGTNATGHREVYIRKNGVTIVAYATVPAVATAGSNTLLPVSCAEDLAVDDYLEVVVWQNSGGSINIVAAGNYSPEFSMIKVG